MKTLLTLQLTIFLLVAVGFLIKKIHIIFRKNINSIVPIDRWLNSFSNPYTCNNNIAFDITVHFQILFACHPPQKLLNGMYILRKKINSLVLENTIPIAKAIIILKKTSHSNTYPYLYIFSSSSVITWFFDCLFTNTSTIFWIILPNTTSLHFSEWSNTLYKVSSTKWPLNLLPILPYRH